MNLKYKSLLILSSIISAFCISMLQQDVTNKKDIVFMILYLTTLFYIAYFALYNYFIRYLKKCSIKKFTAIQIVSIVLSIVVLTLLPVNIKHKVVESEFELTALGQKDTLSNGSEVWIDSIIVDRVNFNVNDLKLESGWEIKNGRIVSYQNQPSTLKLKFSAKESITINFIKHPHSGTAILTYDKNDNKINLYSSVEKYEPYNLPVKKIQLPIIFSLAGYIGYLIIIYSIISIIMLNCLKLTGFKVLQKIGLIKQN